MNLQITHRSKLIFILTAMILVSLIKARAQVVVANPLEWAALIEGNETILSEMKDEIDGETKTAIMQNTISAEFVQIKKWEQKYNNYIKAVDGYASSIKAASHIYNDAVRLFINLCNIKNAVSKNPQGIASTFSMNNLYMETAAELVTVFTTLKTAVAEGGEENMLTGAERSTIMWELNDRLETLNHKLTKLCISLRYYTLGDVLNNITYGIAQHSNGHIAKEAHRRWMRTAKSGGG